MTEPLPYDFSSGNTNPETYPGEALAEAAARVIPELATALNTYPGKLGHEGLRRLLAARESAREGVEVDPDHIVLTNGSMQGVTLVAETFCEGSGDRVVLEELTYNGTIEAYRSLGIEMIGVPVDGNGMRTDRLAGILDEMAREGRPPRFIYTLATYQNPTGAMMPPARRAELLACAKRHGCLVVEDNCYGDVHYDGEKPPALYAMDDWPEQVHIGSLSKIFAPGVRLGYVLARPPLLDRILARRHDAGPNTLSAAITTEYLGPDLWGHVERANAALKAKRDAMLGALEAHLGNWCSWSRPVGGLFIWVRLPDGLDTEALAARAAEHGVGFRPGSEYHVAGKDIPYIRLAFGFPDVATIEAGIARLGECIREAMVPA